MNTLKSFLILNLLSFQIFAANVFINQAGYLPNLPKYFYYSGQADSFYIIEKSTGTIYYSGTLVLSVKNDPATALTLYKGDFSEMRENELDQKRVAMERLLLTIFKKEWDKAKNLG